MAIGTPVEVGWAAWSSGTTIAITLTASVPQGSTLILFSNVMAAGGAQIPITDVADAQTNPWAVGLDKGQDLGPESTDIWFGRMNTGLANGSTVTATYTAAPGRGVASVAYVTGLDGLSPLDKAVGAVGASSAPSSGSSGTLSQTDEICIGVVGSYYAQSTTTLGSIGSFTAMTKIQNSSGTRRCTLWPAYLIVSANTAQTYSGTASGSIRWEDIICTFKGGAGAITATVACAQSSTLAVTPVVIVPATIACAQSSTLVVALVEAATVAFAQTSTLAVTPVEAATVACAQTSTLAVTATVVVPATVAFAQSSTVAVTPVEAATVALGQSSTLAVTPTVIVPATVACGQSSTLAVTPTVLVLATVALDQSSTLDVTPTVLVPATVALDQSSTVAVTATVIVLATVACAQTSTLGVTATVIVSATAALDQSSTLAVTPTVIVPATVALDQASTLALASTVSATVALDQSSTLGATPTVIVPATTALDQSSTLAVTPTVLVPATVALDQTSILDVTPIVAATVALDQSSTLAVTATVVVPATVDLAGTSTLAGTATVAATVVLDQSSTVAVTAISIVPATVACAQTSTLGVTPTVLVPATVAFAQSSTLSITATVVVPATVALDQSSTLTVTAAVVPASVAAALDQSSTLAATPTVIVPATVALDQSSTLGVIIAAAIVFAQSSTLTVGVKAKVTFTQTSTFITPSYKNTVLQDAPSVYFRMDTASRINRINPCEGTDGTNVTTSNTMLGNNFDLATKIGTGTTLKFTTANFHSGTSSIQMHQPGLGFVYLVWAGAIPATSSTAYLRFYAYMTKYPSAGDNARLATLYGGGEVALQITDDGHLHVVDPGLEIVGTMAAPVPLDQWVRIEFQIININTDTGTGTIGARMYSGGHLEGTTYDTGGIITAVGHYIGTAVTSATIGQTAFTTLSGGWDLWVDDIAFSQYVPPSALIGQIILDASGNGYGGYNGRSLQLGQPGALVGDAATSAGQIANTGNIVDFGCRAIGFTPFAEGNTYTVEGWFKAVAAWRQAKGTWGSEFFGDSNDLILVQLGAGTSTEIHFSTPSSTGPDPSYMQWPGAWPGDDQWVYVALTVDDVNGVAELFINGESKGVKAMTHADFSLAETAESSFDFANCHNADQLAWPGYFQEIAFYYQTLLTRDRIGAHYLAGIGRPIVQVPVPVAFEGTSDLGAAAATIFVPATAALEGTSTLSVTDISIFVVAEIALSGTSTLTAAGVRVVPATAALAQTSSLTAAGVVALPATAALDQTSTVGVTATIVVVVPITLAGTSSLATVGVRVVVQAVALTQTSGLSVAGTVLVLATVGLAGDSSLTAVADVWVLAVAALDQSSDLAVTAEYALVAGVGFVGESSLVGAGVLVAFFEVAFSQESTVETAPTLGTAVVVFSNESTLGAAITHFFEIAFSGWSLLSVIADIWRTAEVNLVSVSTLDVTALIFFGPTPSLVGTSDLAVVALVVPVGPVSPVPTIATRLRGPKAMAMVLVGPRTRSVVGAVLVVERKVRGAATQAREAVGPDTSRESSRYSAGV